MDDVVGQFGSRLKQLSAALCERGIFFYVEEEENLSRQWTMEAAEDALPDSYDPAAPIAATCITTIMPDDVSCRVYYDGGKVGASRLTRCEVGRAVADLSLSCGLHADWNGTAEAAVSLSLDDPNKETI